MTKEFNELMRMDYDDLIKHAELTFRAVKIKAYGEGYAQGKFDAMADDMYEPTEDITYWRKFKDSTEEQRKLGAKNMQQRRDEIVERAKGDVREITVHTDTAGPNSGFLLEGRVVVEEEFIVNKETRNIVCLLKGVNSRKVHARGIAKCAPNDCFNVHIGKAIALRRALGLEVPSEYLNAPQPTEVRVGDVCETRDMFDNPYNIPVIAESVRDKFNYDIALARYGTKIIDDSREGVTE